MKKKYTLIIFATIISTLLSCVPGKYKEKNYDKIVEGDTYWYIRSLKKEKDNDYDIKEYLKNINPADSTNTFYKSIKIPGYLTSNPSYLSKDSVLVYKDNSYIGWNAWHNRLAYKLYLNNFLADNNEQFRYMLDTVTYERVHVSDIDSINLIVKTGYKLTDIETDKVIFSKAVEIDIKTENKATNHTFSALMDSTLLSLDYFINDLKYFGVENKLYPLESFPDTLVINNVNPFYLKDGTIDLGYGKSSLYNNEIFIKQIVHVNNHLSIGWFMLSQFDEASSKTPSKLDLGLVSRYYFGNTKGIYIGGSLGWAGFSYTPEKNDDDPIEINTLSSEINLGYLLRINRVIGLGIESFYQYNFTDDIKEIGFTKSSFGARTYFTLFW
ncbi:MAG: hypothetical protein KAG96_03715 [Ichthyobacteriaceae bacterium]|nr:hypothetical protein [Ichthyobacteriaceae bacterium]